MPKNAFKNPFGRRRSSGNVLDIAAEGPLSSAPAGERSSFRVIERPDKTSFHGADGRTPSQNARLNQPRPYNSPLQQARGQSVENLGVGANRYVRPQIKRLISTRLIDSTGVAAALQTPALAVSDTILLQHQHGIALPRRCRRL